MAGHGPWRRLPTLLPATYYLLPARREVEIRRREVGQLPLDERLVLLVVPRVRGRDRLVERLLERREVLRLERRLELRPILLHVLVQRVLVLRPHESRELEQALGLLPLPDRVLPVARLGGVEELPGARAHLGHDPREAGLDDRELVDREVLLLP